MGRCHAPTSLDRWRRAAVLVEDLRDAEPEERMLRLRSECRDDSDLRRYVEGWLSAMEADGESVLDVSLPVVVETLLQALCSGDSG